MPSEVAWSNGYDISFTSGEHRSEMVPGSIPGATSFLPPTNNNFDYEHAIKEHF